MKFQFKVKLVACNYDYTTKDTQLKFLSVDETIRICIKAPSEQGFDLGQNIIIQSSRFFSLSKILAYLGFGTTVIMINSFRGLRIDFT